MENLFPRALPCLRRQSTEVQGWGDTEQVHLASLPPHLPPTSPPSHLTPRHLAPVLPQVPPVTSLDMSAGLNDEQKEIQALATRSAALEDT